MIISKHKGTCTLLLLTAAVAVAAQTPPWGKTGCAPDAPFYTPQGVDDCYDCCQESKCSNSCLNQCKSAAESTASNRKNYCQGYRGPNRDGDPPNTCANKIGDYEDSDCGEYEDCVEKYWSKKVAGSAWDWCMDDLYVPKYDPQCDDYGECVYKQYALKESGKAAYECNNDDDFDPDDYVDGDCIDQCYKRRLLRGEEQDERHLADCQYYSDSGKTTCNCGSGWRDCSGFSSCEKFCSAQKPDDDRWSGAPSQCSEENCKNCQTCCEVLAKEPGRDEDAFASACKDRRCKSGGDRCEDLDDGCPCDSGGGDKPVPKPTPKPDDDCNCVAFKTCVYKQYWNYPFPKDGVEARDDAMYECKRGNAKGDWPSCDHHLDHRPDWNPRCPSWEPWYKACEYGNCDRYLKDLPYKHREDVCDDFWECIKEYERDESGTYSRTKANKARKACNQCDGDDCRSDIGDDHANGNCKEYLGAWDKHCNDYYDCWKSVGVKECNSCASTSTSANCYSRYGACYNGCMTRPHASCQAECDVCFCESNPELAIERCEAVGNECCEDPYGWRNDPKMKNLQYIRKCAAGGKTCGTCGGHCTSDADCTNVNICSIAHGIPNDQIPGCKKRPEDVTGIPSWLDWRDVGYCYNPKQLNRSYESRATVTNDCLAATTMNGYGKCCGLPTDVSQCGLPPKGEYCSTTPSLPIEAEPSWPIIDPEAPEIDEVVEPYTGYYCGSNLTDICESCPTKFDDDNCLDPNDAGCPTGQGQGCFEVTIPFDCPVCDYSDDGTSIERNGGGI